MRDAILDLAVPPGIFTEEQIGQIRSALLGPHVKKQHFETLGVGRNL